MADENSDSSSPPPQPAVEEHRPYAALEQPEFRYYLFGNLLSMLGAQMQTVAVGWEIYERTSSNFALGMVGLIQVIPVVTLALPVGHLIDRVDRRKIIMSALGLLVLCSLGLGLLSWQRGDVRLMYGCLFLTGVARALSQPAKASFLPQIVPRDRFTNAVTWNSGVFQLASILGPALGGVVIALAGGATLVFFIDALVTLTFLVMLTRVASRPVSALMEPVSWRTLAAGLTFVWKTKIILGAITLDMFAVLLGGATTLLPVFAKDILHAGPEGLGWMRAAPGLGAVIMSLLVAHRPPMQRAGRLLLWSVVGFGVATILFGFSRDLRFSLFLLFWIGALDMISVIIRHTLVQTLTPDAMRGRVSAVNSMFIGMSNELGGFESGLVAFFFQRNDDLAFGPTISTVSGGIGTILVVLVVALAWPQVRRFDRLDGSEQL